MTLPTETSAKFAEYANPEKIVSTEWLLENRDDVVLLESDEDILLYETGHIPGAIKIDWHTELTDSLTRDIIDGEQFARMASSKGISRGSTIVIYGDKSNWWAAYALWVFELFGHKDVRLLDGGRDKWISEGREMTTEKPSIKTTEYPIITRDDSKIRAFKPQVRASIGQLPLIDVRSPEEYTGERTHMPAYPEEGALRGGHIPTAASVPWSKAADEDSTFRTRAELEEIYIKGAGLTPGEPVTAYCRIGERSSHTYFVLKYLLGFTDVRNYDGSWTEWGNAVGVPIVRGAEPGKAA